MARIILASVFPGISGSDHHSRLRAALLGTTLLIAVPVLAMAQELPTGGTVASGNVSIRTPAPDSLLIQQNSDRAVVNWDSFSIGSGGAVNIRQPGTNSAILNRVTGDTTSAIHGSLNANGQVFVVNPNGIVIGKEGQVRTGGGFVASTLNISDENFNRGRFVLRGNGASAGVTNLGSISVGRGGYAALIGGRVDNAGTIVAPLGRIGLGAGERVTLDLSGDGFLQVALPSEHDGDDSALVKNSGRVSADGGLIEMRAATARDAARNAINLSGVAEARSVSMQNGAIVLGGGSGGTVRVSGKIATAAPRQPVSSPGLTSSARPPRQSGGEVEITGARIALQGAQLDASGDGGGGLIRIGGDFAGKGSLPRADTLSADAETRIRADALTEGDGGRIVLWSDRYTAMAGDISARGGSEGGDGGFAEVSSAGDVRYRGLTDTRAAKGDWGTLLIDPENISIPGTFSEAAVENNLAITSITLNTASPACCDAGDILISANLDWVAATTFNLIADNDIAITGAINAPNGGLRLMAAGNIGVTGAINIDTLSVDTGNWTQIGPAQPILNVNDFRLSSGATFLRALGGTGTAANPYLLTDLYGLQGMDSRSLLGSHFALANNIDATDTSGWRDFGLAPSGFNPIGASDDAFRGSLDGRGFTIDGLYTSADNFVSGLFHLTDGATIRNLSLTGLDIHGAALAGGVAGRALDTDITNVTASGTVAVEGSQTIRSGGGLVGEMEYGQITDSSFAGTVRDIGSSGSIAGGFDAVSLGGIVGRVHGGAIDPTVLNRVTSSGSVLAEGSDLSAIGGIAGSAGSDSTITNARSSALVRGALAAGSQVTAGGLVGKASGSISFSSASGDVRSMTAAGGSVDHRAQLGGLVGRNDGVITDSSSSGNVLALHDGLNGTHLTAGGFAGYLSEGATISRAFATGDVTVITNNGAAIGGFIAAAIGTITDAYSSGNVDLTQQGVVITGSLRTDVGGFAGYLSGMEIGGATLTRTAAHGSVTVQSTSMDLNVGGHTGSMELGVISDSYADGAVISSSDLRQNVGGLIGVTADSTITNTYANGRVSANGTGATQMGGLIGQNLVSAGAPTTAVTASFYDRGRTGQTPNGLPGYGTALTTATFQNTTAFLALAESQGWDFANVWAPGDSTRNPAIYTIDRVIFARPDDVTLQYGTATPGTTGTTFGGPSVYVFASAGDTLDATSVFDSLVFPNMNVGTHKLTLPTTSLTSAQGDRYYVVDLPGHYTITPAPLVITANDPGKIYGRGFSFSGQEFTNSALFYDDAVDSVTLTSAGSARGANVGDYTIKGSNAQGTGLSNYAITYVAGTLTVDPASLVITAKDQTKTYGRGFTFKGQEFSTSTLFNGDKVRSIDLASAGRGNRANAGSYAITGSGAKGSGLSNYTITYANGTMAVDPATLVITANNQTKPQGKPFSFVGTEFSASGLRAWDSISRVDLASDGAAAGAGATGSPYTITADNASGGGLENYNIIYAAGTMTVKAAPTSTPIQDGIPRPNPIFVTDLPNANDTIALEPETPEGPSATPQRPGTPGTTLIVPVSPDTTIAAVANAKETFTRVNETASLFEIATASCFQSEADVGEYLACLSGALDDFADKLGKISTDLPQGMENVAQVVLDASRSIKGVSAGQRLSADETRHDAINEARRTIAIASAKIRGTITLVRADDPELTRVQTMTINRTAVAVDNVGIQMLRAVGL